MNWTLVIFFTLSSVPNLGWVEICTHLSLVSYNASSELFRVSFNLYLIALVYRFYQKDEIEIATPEALRRIPR